MELNNFLRRVNVLRRSAVLRRSTFLSRSASLSRGASVSRSASLRSTDSLRGGAFLRHMVLAFALLITAVPAWSAKEAPAAETPKTVNINTADATTLADVLKGVGLSKAEAIIAYRKEHGGFKSVDQLSEVKGIGEKLVKANQDRIVVK